MDEEQGKVIDGTARARHWRRSRSESPAAADGDSPRSEAPKSIASSLLVPADMLDGPPPRAAEADRNGPAGAAVVAERDARADAAAFATTSHDNLFLSPDAAVVAPASQRSTRARTAALRAMHALVAGLRTVFEIRLPRPSFTVQRPRRIAFAVGAAALLALTAGIVIDRAATSSSVSRPNTHPGSVAELDRLKATVLSAVGRFLSAVPAKSRATRPARARTARKHTVHKPARTHTVVTRSATAPVAPSYTPPPTPTSATSSSGASSIGASPSSGGTASPSPPATHASSTSGGSPSAFGSSGVLGPGSSPNG